MIDQKVTTAYIFIFFLLCFSCYPFPALSSGDKGPPGEIKLLARMMQGTWEGKIIDPQQEEKTLRLTGKLTPNSDLFELELVTEEDRQIVSIEKFIFHWDASRNVYTCQYSNSSGRTRTSLWVKGNNRDDLIIVQLSKHDYFIRLMDGGVKLLFTVNGKKMEFLRKGHEELQ